MKENLTTWLSHFGVKIVKWHGQLQSPTQTDYSQVVVCFISTIYLSQQTYDAKLFLHFSIPFFSFDELNRPFWGLFADLKKIFDTHKNPTNRCLFFFFISQNITYQRGCLEGVDHDDDTLSGRRGTVVHTCATFKPVPAKYCTYSQINQRISLTNRS